MVENACKLTLVAAFVRFAAGLCRKRANTQGTLCAAPGRPSAWLILELFEAVTMWPVQLIGRFAAVAGMVMGSPLPYYVGRPMPRPATHAELHHDAAARTCREPPHPHHHHNDGRSL